MDSINSGGPGCQLKVTTLSAPAWSPDDSKLVFVGALDGDSNYTELFFVDRDGGHLQKITDIPNWTPWWKRLLYTERAPRRNDQHKSGAPRWSPDGKWIAFMSFGGIYRIHPDGTGLQLVIKGAIYPAWSPDGSMLCYTAVRDGDSVPNIYVSRADGSGETRVTDDHSPMRYSHVYWVN